MSAGQLLRDAGVSRVSGMNEEDKCLESLLKPTKCVCGEPSDTNVVHRSDAPCYCKSQPAQPVIVTMVEAVAAGDGTLHGAIDYWQDRCNKQVEALKLAEDAIKDLRSGLLYIRQTHGDLYGVGWDRAESKAYEALAAIDATSNKEPLMHQLQIPPLADGETYIGAIGDAAGNLQHIILLPGDNDDSTWQIAMAWAQSIGGDLPTRRQQRVLFANAKEHFKPEWYWSGEQHASASSYAWCQGFDYGTQGLNLKDGTGCRARAVRRLPI